ncbi:MAG: hypothetical protein ACXVBO_20650, partial [Isosphaeraceae bacterium]
RVANTSCLRSGRFWLLELRVARTFPYQLRPGFAGNRAGSPIRSRARLYKMNKSWPLELWRSTYSIGPAWFNVFFAAAWPRIKGS